MDDLGQYLPILGLLILGLAFGIITRTFFVLLAPHRPNPAKLAPYECGIVPTREPPERFPVKFYLVAMLFIMFDIEIIFLAPYAVTATQLGAFGLGAILIFSVIFFLSFVYEVAMGGLDWGPSRRDRSGSPAVSASRTASSTIRRVGLEGRGEAA